MVTACCRWGGPQGHGRLTNHRVDVDDGGVGQGGDDGPGQDGLGQDHGRRGIEQAQETQQPLAGQEQIEKQPHHHRRQPHEGVQGVDHRAPPRKPPQGQEGGQGQGDDRRQHEGGAGDPEGQPDDAPQFPQVEAAPGRPEGRSWSLGSTWTLRISWPRSTRRSGANPTARLTWHWG